MFFCKSASLSSSLVLDSGIVLGDTAVNLFAKGGKPFPVVLLYCSKLTVVLFQMAFDLHYLCFQIVDGETHLRLALVLGSERAWYSSQWW